jgi:hypothetical protein
VRGECKEALNDFLKGPDVFKKQVREQKKIEILEKAQNVNFGFMLIILFGLLILLFTSIGVYNPLNFQPEKAIFGFSFNSIFSKANQGRTTDD